MLNRYLRETGDVEGVALLPLFLSCRAAIRAKTSATAASLQTDAARVSELRRTSTEYLALARSFLRPPPPTLMAVGGLSGTGKSTLAMAVAAEIGAVPGAIVLRSDEIRKELCGVESLQRLGPEAYGADISTWVYDTLAARAQALLRTGHSVIVDAVYARKRDRDAIERIARTVAVPFEGLWLEAPTRVLVDRVRCRRGDPSDADAGVVQVQAAEDPGRVRWHHLDAARAADAVLRDVIAIARGAPATPVGSVIAGH